MKYSLFVFLALLWNLPPLVALPGKVVDEYRFSIPIISLESLDLDTYKVLRKFDPREHLPEINQQEHLDYFLHRNRTVYLTADEKFVVKVWQLQYPSSPAFLRAISKNFYRGIAKVEALIFDQHGNCRGYVTPYMVSRAFHRTQWDANGYVLEKNAFGVNIFSRHEMQPQNYNDLFTLLVNNTLETGIVSSDFCPNNTVIDPTTGRMYLIDLEDVLDLKNIALEDPEIQMVLEYNPRDYLQQLNLFK